MARGRWQTFIYGKPQETDVLEDFEQWKVLLSIREDMSRDIGSFIAMLVREVHIHSTGDLGWRWHHLSRLSEPPRGNFSGANLFLHFKNWERLLSIRHHPAMFLSFLDPSLLNSVVRTRKAWLWPAGRRRVGTGNNLFFYIRKWKNVLVLYATFAKNEFPCPCFSHQHWLLELYIDGMRV